MEGPGSPRKHWCTELSVAGPNYGLSEMDTETNEQSELELFRLNGLFVRTPETEVTGYDPEVHSSGLVDISAISSKSRECLLVGANLLFGNSDSLGFVIESVWRRESSELIRKDLNVAVLEALLSSGLGAQNREPFITPTLAARIEKSFQMTAEESRIQLRAVGFMPDHVHLIESIPPAVAISEAVRRLKGASSHSANQITGTTSKFAWQPDYGVLSFDERVLRSVLAYVLNQPRIHEQRKTREALERMSSDEASTPT